MADQLRERYSDLVVGGYDCIDPGRAQRLLHAGPQPGRARTWWRRLHGGSDEQLDNTHLMRMAGRFSRRVRALAKAQAAVIDCKRGDRKHLIAEQHLATHSVGTGVFLVLVAKAPASVWCSTDKVVSMCQAALTGRPS
ncbi:MAG: hypothetical protein H0V93_13940 [Euzebyales bacterium]|jgi:hypothetical protein|nr:hypothetical protein [Euzebyales bacterium]